MTGGKQGLYKEVYLVLGARYVVVSCGNFRAEESNMRERLCGAIAGIVKIVGRLEARVPSERGLVRWNC